MHLFLKSIQALNFSKVKTDEFFAPRHCFRTTGNWLWRSWRYSGLQPWLIHLPENSIKNSYPPVKKLLMAVEHVGDHCAAIFTDE